MSTAQAAASRPARTRREDPRSTVTRWARGTAAPGRRARRRRAVGRLRERGRGARRHVHRRRGRRLRDHRAERQRQVLDPDGRHRHGPPPRRGGRSSARPPGTATSSGRRGTGSRWCPSAASSTRTCQHRGQHHPRLLHVDEKHRQGSKIGRLRARDGPLPRAEAAPQAGGGHLVRRPAADGGDRPRAGRQPEDPRRRRAVPRPRRGGRQAGVRRARADPRGRHHADRRRGGTAPGADPVQPARRGAQRHGSRPPGDAPPYPPESAA